MARTMSNKTALMGCKSCKVNKSNIQTSLRWMPSRFAQTVLRNATQVKGLRQDKTATG